jgi:serine phosphatase RsbU (regulator of sigma subunit)
MSTHEISNDSHKWPEARQYKKSIRFEFSLYISAIILILMLVTGIVFTNQFVKSITRNEVETLVVQARSYSGPAGKLIISAETPDALMLNNICSKLSADNPEVFWVGIADQDNVFLAHTDIKEVIASARMSPVTTVEFEDLLRPGEAFDLKQDTLQIIVPIIENGITVGRLKVASSARQISEARKTSIMAVALITALMIILGIPLTMVLLHRKLRPVTEISDHLKEVNLDEISLNIPVRKKNEFGYLAETLRVMGDKLNVAQKELVEKERFSRELEIAREIQSNILPRGCPAHPFFEFSVDYQSAREVGGDYYDFIEFDNDLLGFLVADVSGKSLPGMLVMLLTRDIVKRLAHSTPDPARLLQKVNRELIVNIKKGMFVTMFLGVLDKSTGEFTFASAGHNPLIRLNDNSGEVELIKTRGFPLGMMGPEQFDRRIERGKVFLSAGDWLIQYTDGINEARSPEDDEYGMKRFIEEIKINRGKTPGELVGGIIKRHSEFVAEAPQFDDITLLVMKWHGETVEEKIENSNGCVQTVK